MLLVLILALEIQPTRTALYVRSAGCNQGLQIVDLDCACEDAKALLFPDLVGVVPGFDATTGEIHFGDEWSGGGGGERQRVRSAFCVPARIQTRFTRST